MDRSLRSGTVSEQSDSGNEVEHMLLGTSSRMSTGWGHGGIRSQSAFAPAAKRTSRGFRPAIPNP
ncbi:hypothetical protein AN958_07943 [Leucoagaricus sp. SymC.cos]|nr:hypothetical protein AN958_07943 [Leucoagaricus sp. SymC.cos]